MNNSKHIVFNTLMTVICFLFIVTMSVTLILYLKPLYYMMVRILDVPAMSGYSYEVCKTNYDILIDYNMAWGPKSLEFRDFVMSITGRIHFEEVKRIFVTIQITSWVTMVLTIIGYIAAHKLKAWVWLRNTIIMALVVGGSVGAALAIDWDWTFVFMHSLLFDNDYWLFDPTTDPVINILPDSVFLAAAVGILVFLAIGLVICGVLYKKHHKRGKKF